MYLSVQQQPHIIGYVTDLPLILRPELACCRGYGPGAGLVTPDDTSLPRPLDALLSKLFLFPACCGAPAVAPKTIPPSLLALSSIPGLVGGAIAPGNLGDTSKGFVLAAALAVLKSPVGLFRGNEGIVVDCSFASFAARGWTSAERVRERCMPVLEDG